MDNASGNVPNNPQPQSRGAEMTGVGNTSQVTGHLLQQNAAATSAGQAAEGVIPGPPVASPGIESPVSQPGQTSRSRSLDSHTLSNDQVLYSPTPIDRDPPPLSDVPPPTQTPTASAARPSTQPTQIEPVVDSEPIVPMEPVVIDEGVELEQPVVSPETVIEEPVVLEPVAVTEEPAIIEPSMIPQESVVQEPMVLEEPAIIEQPAVQEEPEFQEPPALAEEIPSPHVLELPEEPEAPGLVGVLPLEEPGAPQVEDVFPQPGTTDLPLEPSPEVILETEEVIPADSLPLPDPEPELISDPVSIGGDLPLEAPVEEEPVVDETHLEGLPTLLLNHEVGAEQPPVEETQPLESEVTEPAPEESLELESLTITDEAELQIEEPPAEVSPEETVAGEDNIGDTEISSETGTLTEPIDDGEVKEGGDQAEIRNEGYVKNEFFVSEGAEDPWILPASAAARASDNQKRAAGDKPAPLKSNSWSLFTTVFFFGSLLVIGALFLVWLSRGSIASKIESDVARQIREAGLFIDYQSWKYDPVRGIVLDDLTVFEDEEQTISYARVDNVGVNTDFLTLFKTKDPAAQKNVFSFDNSNLRLFDRGQMIADFVGLDGDLALTMKNRLVEIDDLKGQLEGVQFEVDGDIILPKSGDNGVASSRNKLPVSSSMPTTDSTAQSILRSISDAERKANEGVRGTNDGIVIPGAMPAPTEEQTEEESKKPLFAPRTDLILPKTEPEPEPPAAPAPEAETAVAPPPIPEPETEIDPLQDPALDPRLDPGPGTVPEPQSIPAPQTIPTPEPDKTIVLEAPTIEPPVASDRPANDSGIPDSISIPSTDDVVTSTEALTPPAPAAKPRSGSGEPIKLPSLAALRDITPFLRVAQSRSLPNLSGHVAIDLTDSASQKVEVAGRLTGEDVTLEETQLAGITFKVVDIPYQFDQQAGLLKMNGFTLGYDKGGQLTGDAVYDLENQVLSLMEVRSNVDPIQFVGEFNPDLKKSFQNVQFLDIPEIVIFKGNIPLDDPAKTSLDFSYEQWAGLVVNAGGRSLPIREVRGQFQLDQQVLSVPSLRASVLGGPADAVGSMRLNEPNFPFNGSLKFRGISMESIAEYTGINSQMMKGTINLDYQGIVSSQIAQYSGNGNVELLDGQLFEVPVIGAVQRLLGAAIPVFDVENQTTVSGTYVIDSGVLTTSDLLVRGEGTKISVKGQADLSRQLTAFSARANLEGPLGVATGLVSEVIEVEGRGPLKNPQLRLKGGALPEGFSDEAVRQVLGIADGTTEAMSAVMQEIASGGGAAVGGLLNGIGVRKSEGNPANPEGSANPLEGAAGILERILPGNQ